MTMTACCRLLLLSAILSGRSPALTPPRRCPPPDEEILVVNSTEASLSMVPVHNPGSAKAIPLGGTTPTPTTVAALDAWAVVPLGLDNSVAVVDLATGQVARRIAAPCRLGGDRRRHRRRFHRLCGNPNLNTVTRVNYLTGDTASVAVGVYPQGNRIHPGQDLRAERQPGAVRPGRPQLDHAWWTRSPIPWPMAWIPSR